MPLTCLYPEQIFGLEDPFVTDSEFLLSPTYLPIYGDRFTGTKGSTLDFAFATFRDGQSDYITWNIMPPSGVKRIYLSCIFSPTSTQYGYIRWEITAQEWLINDIWTAGLYVSDYQDIYYSYVSNGVYKNISTIDLSPLTSPIEILKIKLRRLGASDSASFGVRSLGFSIQYTR